MKSLTNSDFAALFASELGWVALVGSRRTVRWLTFGHGTAEAAMGAVERAGIPFADVCCWDKRLVSRIQAYAAGKQDDFSDVLVDLGRQSAFQQRIVRACRAIKFGCTMTYGEVAMAAGSPRAARAVGNCMAANTVPLIIPCHRVVRSGGSPGGYSAGEDIRMKLRLLEIEGALVAV